MITTIGRMYRATPLGTSILDLIVTFASPMTAFK